MKRLQFVLLFFIFTFSSCAASMDKVIKLPAPDMNRPATVMHALQERKSTREYSVKELDLKDLSDLLWAANGYNRPAEEKRTAPSAMNRQDVDVYVILEKGAYFYDAKEHALNMVVEGDYRSAIAGGQDFVLQAPVSILLVTDLAKMGDPENDRTKAMCAVDVGIVSQNISIFCAAANLATVPRASMDEAALKEALQLTDSQWSVMNHPVGYFK